MKTNKKHIKVRKRKKLSPDKIIYPFHKLKKAGTFFFLPGANAHRVQSARYSYQKGHPEIAEAGHKLRACKGKEKVDGVMVDGVRVFRVLIENDNL